MPLMLLSEFLGHSNVNTTRVYAWADTEMKREAISKIESEQDSQAEPIWKNDENMIKRLYGLA
jgi:site-specific recombinase XerD